MPGIWNSDEPPRPLKWAALLAPESADITLEDGKIFWCVRADPERAYGSYLRQFQPPKGLLMRFVRLQDKKEPEYLRFAKRWGCLALCKHGLPTTHNPACSASLHESVEQWRSLSAQAHAILKIRDALNLRVRPDPADWKRALSLPSQLGWGWAREIVAQEVAAQKVVAQKRPRVHPFSQYFGQDELSQCVQAWLDAADVGPRLTWNSREKRYQILLAPSGFWWPNLFAHLAMELMLAVADVGRLAICSGCGNSYEPVKKRPAEGRRNFCRGCGRKAAVRLAQQRFREREKHKLKRQRRAK